MELLLIKPKDKTELKFLAELLAKMDIATMRLTDEDIEDAGLVALIKQADRSQKVSREAVCQKLTSI